MKTPKPWSFNGISDDYANALAARATRQEKALIKAVVRAIKRADAHRYDADQPIESAGYREGLKAIDGFEIAVINDAENNKTAKLIEGHLKKLSDHNQRGFEEQWHTVFGINPLEGDDGRLKATLADTLNTSVNKIKTLDKQHFTALRNILAKGYIDGSTTDDLEKVIAKQFGVTRWRARFYAVNEMGNLNAALTEHRQTEAGVKRYIWRTSQDERVRPSHIVKEGETFSWDDPPDDTGHPGRDYRCRCTAEPILDDADLPDENEFWNLFEPEQEQDPEPVEIPFFAKVKDLRTRLGISQDQIATDLGKSRGWVSGFETGRNSAKKDLGRMRGYLQAKGALPDELDRIFGTIEAEPWIKPSVITKVAPKVAPVAEVLTDPVVVITTPKIPDFDRSGLSLDKVEATGMFDVSPIIGDEAKRVHLIVKLIDDVAKAGGKSRVDVMIDSGFKAALAKNMMVSEETLFSMMTSQGDAKVNNFIGLVYPKEFAKLKGFFSRAGMTDDVLNCLFGEKVGFDIDDSIHPNAGELLDHFFGADHVEVRKRMSEIENDLRDAFKNKIGRNFRSEVTPDELISDMQKLKDGSYEIPLNDAGLYFTSDQQVVDIVDARWKKFLSETGLVENKVDSERVLFGSDRRINTLWQKQKLLKSETRDLEEAKKRVMSPFYFEFQSNDQFNPIDFFNSESAPDFENSLDLFMKEIGVSKSLEKVILKVSKDINSSFIFNNNVDEDVIIAFAGMKAKDVSKAAGIDEKVESFFMDFASWRKKTLRPFDESPEYIKQLGIVEKFKNEVAQIEAELIKQGVDPSTVKHETETLKDYLTSKAALFKTKIDAHGFKVEYRNDLSMRDLSWKPIDGTNDAAEKAIKQDLVREIAGGGSDALVSGGRGIQFQSTYNVKSTVHVSSQAIDKISGDGIKDFENLFPASAQTKGKKPVLVIGYTSVRGFQTDLSAGRYVMINRGGYGGKQTVVHELGHFSESTNPVIQEAAKRYLITKAAKEKDGSFKLTSKNGEAGFVIDANAGIDEQYAMRIYSHGAKVKGFNDIEATEITSLAFEKMNRILERGEAGTITKSDLSLFKWAIAAASGDFQ